LRRISACGAVSSLRQRTVQKYVNGSGSSMR
jgi:hypothetical protein